MSTMAFFYYTLASSAFFGLAIFWILVQWVRADERADEAQLTLPTARPAIPDDAELGHLPGDHRTLTHG